MYTVIINDHKEKILHFKDVISYVFNIPLYHSKFSSPERLADNLITAANLAIEFLNIVKMDRLEAGFKGSEIGIITRMITKMNDYKEHVLETLAYGEKHVDFDPKEKLTSSVYNLILAYEGCGLLNGFGMSNIHKDKLVGNPEVRSIYPETIMKTSAMISKKIIQKEVRDKQRRNQEL